MKFYEKYKNIFNCFHKSILEKKDQDITSIKDFVISDNYFSLPATTIFP